MKLAAKQALSRPGPLLVIAVAVGALGGAAATVFAVGDGARGGPVTARVTAQQAAAAALKAVPGGRIEGLEVDYDGRVLRWEADALTGDGTKRELFIDARDGRLIANHIESPKEGDDKGNCKDGKPGGTSGHPDDATKLRSAKITAARAARTALDTVPGTLTSVDFERRHNEHIWEIDLVDHDNQEHRLLIDPVSGKVRANIAGEDD